MSNKSQSTTGEGKASRVPETVISVWVDKISEPGKAWVIVSLDNGGSTTLRAFRNSGPKTAAKAFARREAKRRGLPAVIESPEGSGKWIPLVARAKGGAL